MIHSNSGFFCIQNRERLDGFQPDIFQWLEDKAPARADHPRSEHITVHEAVNPDECLFIDDRTENIQGAEALGINTYRYIYEEDPDAIVLGQFIRNNYTLVS